MKYDAHFYRNVMSLISTGISWIFSCYLIPGSHSLIDLVFLYIYKELKRKFFTWAKSHDEMGMKAGLGFQSSGKNYSPVLEHFHQTTFSYYFYLIHFHMSWESIGFKLKCSYAANIPYLHFVISAKFLKVTFSMLTSCCSPCPSPLSCSFLIHFAKCDLLLPTSLGLCIFLTALLTLLQ